MVFDNLVGVELEFGIMHKSEPCLFWLITWWGVQNMTMIRWSWLILWYHARSSYAIFVGFDILVWYVDMLRRRSCVF